MSGYRILAGLVVVASAVASGAQAQDAPASATVAAPAPSYPYIGVYGFSPAIRPGGETMGGWIEPSMLRRAMPVGDIRDWIAADDPALEFVRTNPRGGGYVSLVLTIDANGRATGCERDRPGGPTFAEGLCERIVPRVAMTPALSAQGQRVGDRYVYLTYLGTSSTPPNRPVDIRQLPPAPMMVDQWPPLSDNLNVKVERLDTLASGPASPAATSEPWAGVRISQNTEGRIVCALGGSSGDADFDRRVCETVRRGRYDFGERRFASRAIHFVLDSGKPRALLAIHERPQRPAAVPESLTAVATALPAPAVPSLRFQLSIDATGRVTQCMITASSGDDATDVAACTAMRDQGRFTPAMDVFGRPKEGGAYDLALPPLA